jgi:geranylgeranyl transferase type-2 subunit beta
LDTIDTQKTADCLFMLLDVLSLRQPDGSWAGDEFGEIDTRFTYCAVSCLSLLNRLDSFPKAKTLDYLISCQNFGVFGD